MVARADIIWEKGTNRSAFFRGDVDKYGWVDIGSSFLPSEVTSAFLYSQLENSTHIQRKRTHIWNEYHCRLKKWAHKNEIIQNKVPLYSSNNGHMYYLILKSLESRNKFIANLKNKGVRSAFHYNSLHKSKFIGGSSEICKNSDRFSDCLVRLPLFTGMSESQLDYVISTILSLET